MAGGKNTESKVRLMRIDAGQVWRGRAGWGRGTGTQEGNAVQRDTQ